MNGSLQLGNRLREKKPRPNETRRRCWCGTFLSMYNDGDECYVHKPYKKPRIRGGP